MGWVTLVCHKEALKVEHNNYELQLLNISRRRREIARSKQADTAGLTADKQAQIEAAKSSTGYTEAKNAYNEAIKSGDDDSISQASTAYTAAKAEYDEQKEYIEQYSESEMEEIEAECTELENELDTRQTQIEAINEQIVQEIEAADEAISSDIQSSTIKLA